MRNLNLFWIFGLFLLILPFVNANHILYNATPFTNISDWNGGCTLTDGKIDCTSAQNMRFVHKLINLSTNGGTNMTIIFNASIPAASNSFEAITTHTENVTAPTTNKIHFLIRFAAANIHTVDPGGSTGNQFQLFPETSAAWHTERWEYLSNSSINVYINGTFKHNIKFGDVGTDKPTGNFTYFFLNPIPRAAVTIGSFVVFNGTGELSDTSSDRTPPEITFYNMTSEGGAGCTNWTTNKSVPCVTSDATPTVKINTNENAYCAIGISDLNYSDLGLGRQCSGGGTSEHTCTLTSQDELVYEISYVYMGCRDYSSNQNQNRTSTSGALSLNITGLETISKNAIESGIRNALLSGYTIYTDQKIYARNSANNQSVGVFDKVAKKLNKIWAFNRIGQYDGYVNMFNITPVFYTLEFANKTSVQITNQTELLINSTK
ncbi:hypothetical protein HYX04_04045 [Candidatus Woesearchaeota archaeon]|nr:hypothetical protein [Candidatus Woesearchaeota archaeon]